jgi:hypothetical protein
MSEQVRGKQQMLLVSDFDQTLSFNDSGIVLSEMLGITGFEQRVSGLAEIHMLQQGGELPYLLLHAIPSTGGFAGSICGKSESASASRRTSN